MESLPVLEVIEVNGVKDRSGVSDSDSGEDCTTGGVIVIIGDDSVIMRVDGSGVKRAPFLVEDPLLTCGVTRLVCLDVVEEDFAVDADGIESHLVEASARSRVVRVKFASGVERSFLPETWQVKDSERSGDTGCDGRNDLAHFSNFVLGFCSQGPRPSATCVDCYPERTCVAND